MTAPLIYVDLIEEKPQTWDEYSHRRANVSEMQYQRYLAKFQPWRWVALRSGNHRKLARSTERYFNRADCLDAIDLLFTTVSNVYLRQAEHPDVPLRMAQ